MGRGGSNGSGSRFLRYVGRLVSVIGHADRAGPLHDYCLGLMASRGRKSVEPMAARTAPHRTSAQHQSLLHFVGAAGWSDEKVLTKVREMVLPEIERHGSIRSVFITNIADNWASRRTARSRCRCRSQTTTPACRLLISFICPRPGLKIGLDGARPACLKRSGSRQNLRLRLITSVGPARQEYRAATSCWTLGLATIPSCGRAFLQKG